MLNCFVNHAKKVTPINVVTQSEFSNWLTKQEPHIKNWLTANQFKGEPGNLNLVPDLKGKLDRVIFCVHDTNHFWSCGILPFSLPEGVYTLNVSEERFPLFATAWGLGAYQFSQYKKPMRNPAQLVLSKSFSELNNIVQSIYQVRDLINTPTDDLGPSEFAEKIKNFCKDYKIQFHQIVGENLLKENYPTIYAVGRACDDAPRLVDLRWGNKKNPKVTLVGKGVCFDTGGLDIKNSSGMLLMKKDMGGAAHVLGLAQMIVEANLPINLRVIIPLVENSISGNAYRPGDIIKTRKGITVEVGNTDAEGRLVLCDALTEAVTDNPDLIIDIATLTGAARIALGTDLPAMFCNNDKVAHDVIKASEEQFDPVWRMPLFTAYRESLNSPIADINNAGVDSYGGAITAALFLKEFVPDNIPWLHFDLMAWNLKARPGRPHGGEAMGLRALFAYLRKKYYK